MYTYVHIYYILPFFVICNVYFIKLQPCTLSANEADVTKPECADINQY